jgi:hypothetical protein
VTAKWFCIKTPVESYEAKNIFLAGKSGFFRILRNPKKYKQKAEHVHTVQRLICQSKVTNPTAPRMRGLSELLPLSFLCLLSCPHAVGGSSTWISDERVKDLNSSPVLGRGYSIRSNTYRSNCLLVGGTSTPSFNYDCKFIFSRGCSLFVLICLISSIQNISLIVFFNTK